MEGLLLAGLPHLVLLSPCSFDPLFLMFLCPFTIFISSYWGPLFLCPTALFLISPIPLYHLNIPLVSNHTWAPVCMSYCASCLLFPCLLSLYFIIFGPLFMCPTVPHVSKLYISLSLYHPYLTLLRPLFLCLTAPHVFQSLSHCLNTLHT